MKTTFLSRVTLLAVLSGFPGFGMAQSTRETLPIPDPPFKGKAGLRASDSVKDFPAEPKAPEGAQCAPHPHR